MYDVWMARWACVVIVMVGCYTAPSPPCGFICGASSACPDGYTCDVDNRCHFDDTSVACDDAVDAGVSVVPPPPTHVSFDPPRGATGVKTTDSVTVTFDVAVQNVDESTFQLRSNGVAIDGIVVADGTAEATFVPAHLPSGAIVEGSLDPTITTVDKGKSIGLQLWSFATEVDTTPPMVTGFAPGDGATNAEVSSGIAIGFDEDVGNASSIRVTSGGVPVPGTWAYQVNDASYAAFFQPVAVQLPAFAIIEVNTTPLVCDYAGNPIVPFTARFMTGADNYHPFVLGVAPAPNAVDVPTTTVVVLTFNEPIVAADPNNDFFVGHDDDNLPSPTLSAVPSLDGTVWTLTPTDPLPSASLIRVGLGGDNTDITDLAGNAVQLFDSYFTTK